MIEQTMREVIYFFELLYFLKLKHLNWKNSYPSFQLYIKYMHCGSECVFANWSSSWFWLVNICIVAPLIGLRWLVLLAAPSNLPIQVLILPCLSPVQPSVHQLSLIILMESQLSDATCLNKQKTWKQSQFFRTIVAIIVIVTFQVECRHHVF